LAAHQRVETVNRGDARFDEVVGRVTRHGVNGGTADFHFLLGHNRGQAVDGNAGAVETAADYVGGAGDLGGHVAQGHRGALNVDATGTLKDLEHGVGFGGFQD